MRCECFKARIARAQIHAIPERFRECTFENYSPKDETEAEALRRMQSDPGGSFFIYGRYGHGKTHLLAAQYRLLIESGESCALMSMSEMLFELRRRETDHEYFSKVVDRVRYADSFHLFIDDIDKFKPTEFKAEALFDLVDTIYRRKLALTVTTNLGMQALSETERLEPAILRRFDDMCTAVEV